jgi:Tfp pilus assembly protein PilF
VLLSYRCDRFFSRDNYITARDCLESAVESDPNYPEALSALSYVYGDGYLMDLADDDSSIDFLGEAQRLALMAVDLDPTSAGAQRQLAIAYFRNGELNKFYAHAERALSLNPHDPSTLGLLGTLMSYTGDYVVPCHWYARHARSTRIRVPGRNSLLPGTTFHDASGMPAVR